jgi:hypothetical protein
MNDKTKDEHYYVSSNWPGKAGSVLFQEVKIPLYYNNKGNHLDTMVLGFPQFSGFFLSVKTCLSNCIACEFSCFSLQVHERHSNQWTPLDLIILPLLLLDDYHHVLFC